MAGAKPKRPRGRPSFEPTDDQRRMVEAMVAFGIPQEEIARTLTPKGISMVTLNKHFRQELDNGATRYHMRLGLRLYQISQQSEDLRSATTATIFALKARFGWKEAQAIEHSGPEGGAIEYEGGMEPVTIIIEGGSGHGGDGTQTPR